MDCPVSVPEAFNCSYGIGGSLRCQPSRFPDIRWQFLGALPIAEIEPSSAFSANDELLLKSLERTAIEAVRFNGTGNPVLSE
jgi:hypothetical protein